MPTAPRTASRRWKGWRTLDRADRVAAVLTAVAILFLAAPLFRGPPGAGHPTGFVDIAPFVAAGFLVALIAMFLEVKRHGPVRALLGIGTAVLAVAAIAYSGRVPTSELILAYWIPAILGAASAIVIARAKRTVAST